MGILDRSIPSVFRVHRRRPPVCRRRRSQRGNAVIEAAFLAPWVLFLIIGAVDMGFFTYSMVAVENAARIAAEQTSKATSFAGSTDTACTAARRELSGLPNMSGVTTCTAAPLVVTATATTGPDGGDATQVSVTYQGLQMIPIPGFLMGRLNITRIVLTRVKPT